MLVVPFTKAPEGSMYHEGHTRRYSSHHSRARTPRLVEQAWRGASPAAALARGDRA